MFKTLNTDLFKLFVFVGRHNYASLHHNPFKLKYCVTPVSKSTDGGQTWTNAKILNDDPKGIDRAQHHPTLFVNDKGTIVAGWYDRRADSLNKNADFFLAVSKDGGDSFSQLPITSSPTDITTKGTFHIGEYVQVLASDNTAIPVWIDGRSAGADLEIYVSFLNLNNLTSIREFSVVSDKISVKPIYPNPAKNQINLNLKLKAKSNISIHLLDVQGKQISKFQNNKTFETGEYNLPFSIENLASGTYFIEIQSDFGRLVRKFIKAN